MEVLYSKELYSKEALLKTAFSYTDQFYLHLSQDNSNWKVEIIPKADVSLSTLNFENELIRQETQITILKNNTDLRKLILARALASTIVDSDSEMILNQDSDTNPDNTITTSSLNLENDIFNGEEILRSWFDDKQSSEF